MRIEVTYNAQFKAKVEIPDSTTDQEVADIIGDVDIPEGGANESRYVECTFDVVSAVDLDTGFRLV